jgi:uncharacterized protein YbdZ (MbtH family)
MFREFPDEAKYKVVINHEEQYTVLPASRKGPLGWKLELFLSLD